MHNQQSVQENETHKIRDFEIQTDHLISARPPELGIVPPRKKNDQVNKKTKTKKITNEQTKPYRIVNFSVSADHRVKLKEGKKRGKYLDLAWELKKLWNLNVTVISIVIGVLGTITKGWVQELEALGKWGRVETIQTTALLRSARILRRVLETWEDLLSLKLQWKTISYCWCKK